MPLRPPLGATSAASLPAPSMPTHGTPTSSSASASRLSSTCSNVNLRAHPWCPSSSPRCPLRTRRGISQASVPRCCVVDAVSLGAQLMRRLSDFLDHVQRPLRVVPFVEAGRKVGVIHYSTLIPASLRRLIVLDASHNIRLLTSEHDADLHVTGVDCGVKSFDAVTVRHLQVGAGREALGKSLPRRDSPLVREIVEEVKSWPADEAGVVFTFKQSERDARKRKPSHADYIREALTRAGIDVDATMPDGKPRLVFLTWGQHLGVNGYAYCTRVLMVGVLRRHRLDLSAAIAGQRDDLTAQQAADPDGSPACRTVRGLPQHRAGSRARLLQDHRRRPRTANAGCPPLLR